MNGPPKNDPSLLSTFFDFLFKKLQNTLHQKKFKKPQNKRNNITFVYYLKTKKKNYITPAIRFENFQVLLIIFRVSSYKVLIPLCPKRDVQNHYHASQKNIGMMNYIYNIDFV